MAVERKQMMNAMATFKDPKQMRLKYGILITDDQILKAQKILYKSPSSESIFFQNINEGS